MIALIVAVMVLYSCDGTPKAVSGGAVEVSMVASMEKNLDSFIDRNIASWEFMATPQFQLAPGEYIYGQVFNWKELTAIRTGADGVVQTATTLGRYTSGNWLFELRCKNKDGKIIAIGSTEQIVREGIDNTVNISLYVDRADGTHGESDKKGAMRVGFEINRLDANVTDNMQIVTTYRKVNKDRSLDTTQTPILNWNFIEEGGSLPAWYAGTGDKKVGEGRVFYYATLSEIPAGPYAFIFKAQGKNTAGSMIDLGGQSIDVMILGDETTDVKGTLLANEYVVAGLKIKAPGKVVGSINGKTYILGTPGTPVALSYIHNNEESSEDAVSYYWYVNNVLEQQSNSPNFQFDCPKDGSDNFIYGIYKVTVVAVGELGSLGTEVCDVVFNPPTGPNLGEFDWQAAIGGDAPSGV